MCKNENYDSEKGKYMCKRSKGFCVTKEKGLMCSLFEDADGDDKLGKLRELRLLKKKKLSEKTDQG